MRILRARATKATVTRSLDPRACAPRGRGRPAGSRVIPDKLHLPCGPPQGGQEATHATGILPRFRGRPVHDAWRSYFTLDQCAHALCNAHHLRELKFVTEEYSQAWAAEMSGLLLAIKDEVEASPPGSTSLPRERLVDYERRYDTLLQCGFAANPPPPETEPKKRGRKKQFPPKNLLDRLAKRRAETPAFMRDFRVPFDNSLAMCG